VASYDALIVVSFGGPEGPDDVLPFLDNVLRGRPISEERKRQVAEHYHRFGGRSPINDQCRALIAARFAKTPNRRVIQTYDERRVAVDAGENRFAWPLPPLVASIEGVLALLTIFQTGVRPHQKERLVVMLQILFSRSRNGINI
jgi:hypothetical protein